MSNLIEARVPAYAGNVMRKGDVRYELIEGIAYAMPAPSFLHQKVSKRIFRQLDNFLIGKAYEAYYAPLAVRLNADDFDDTVVEPDLLVVSDETEIDVRGVKGAPELIVEILSMFNTKHDIDRKFKQYQKAGVKEYWIVDPTRRIVEAYILKDGRYGVGSVYREDDIIPAYVLSGCEINLAEVFAGAVKVEEDIETEIRTNMMRALKAIGVDINDGQIEKAAEIFGGREREVGLEVREVGAGLREQQREAGLDVKEVGLELREVGLELKEQNMGKSVLGLSSKAEYLMRALYREYTARRESGMGKSEAFAVGDMNYICEKVAPDLSRAGIEAASEELYANNLIFKNLWGYIALKNEFLDFCGNNYVKV